MQNFKVTLNSEPGKVQANDIKVVLRDHYMEKIKSEGINLGVWPIIVEEIINEEKNVIIDKKEKKTAVKSRNRNN